MQTFKMSERGFTILEVIAAIFVLLIGVLSAYSVTSQLISSTHLAANRLTAAYLAKEGVEIVRNIRDTNWVEPAPSWNDDLGTGNYETDYNDSGLTSCLPCEYNNLRFLRFDTNFFNYENGDNTNFKRKINITPDGFDKLDVTVEVWWKEKGVIKGPITVKENLYNWYPI